MKYTVKENKKLGGLEVEFTAKPASETREALKEIGFRWSKKNAVWYHKNFKGLDAIVRKALGSNVQAEKAEKIAKTEKVERSNKSLDSNIEALAKNIAKAFASFVK
jgi:hypothetical protein